MVSQQSLLIITWALTMRRHRTLPLLPLTVFVILLTSLAHADLQAGKDAYDQGDYSTALKEWRPLAEQGDATAQKLLGLMYGLGEGVPQDYSQAHDWLLKAAEQGDATAQHSLAFLYIQGRGVPQDYTQAASWWVKAAEQGYAEAQWSLGLLYAMGQGVPQDYVQAHMWYNLAAAQGDEQARDLRDKRANKMIPAQIAEAQRLASEWQAQHQK